MEQKINMEKGFIQIIALGIISAVLGMALILEMPFSWLEGLTSKNIGTTVTDISTATKFADFPAIYNANNLAINNGKFELSDWYATTTAPWLTTLLNLASVGTITTGTWNATAIGVSKGGTGTTSPTSNYVMLGNGSSGLKVVSGLGTSGQFLTSGGAGTPPTWTTSAIDEAGNYTWTGAHSWSNTNNMTGNTYIKNLNASSTVANPMTLNGLTYNIPFTRAASSTILMEDGSGNLTFQKSPYSILYTSSAPFGSGTTTVTIPAGLLLGINKLKIDFDCTVGSPQYSYVRIGNGSATTTMVENLNSQGGGVIYVVPQGATSQIYYGHYRNNSNIITSLTGTALSLTAANKIYITFELTSGTFYNAMVTLITQ